MKKNNFVFAIILIVVLLSATLFSCDMFSKKEHVHSLSYYEGYEPTCVLSGYKSNYVCDDCGKIFADEDGKQELTTEDLIIPAKGHTPQKVDGYASSCTVKGLSDGTKCAECGTWIKTQNELKLLDHKDVNNDCVCDDCGSTDAHHYSSWTQDVEQTCTQDGHKYRTCNVCQYKQEETLLMLNHPYSEREYKSEKKATCQEEGNTAGWVCKLCDYKVGYEKIKATAHNYFRGTCSYCGEAEPTANLQYNEIKSKGEVIAYSVEMGSANSKNIIIPSTYNGLPVTKIAPNGFNNRTIESVVIGLNVTDITSAFSGATNLETVIFQENSKIKAIQNNAFYNCQNLTTIELPNNVTSIGESAFENCLRLELMPSTSNLKTIGASAFKDCNKINEIVISSIITNIGVSAFEGCSGATSITLNGETTISDRAFYNCSKVNTINLNNAINSFSSNNNVFSNVGKNTNGVEVVIGSRVNSIPSYAFTSLTNIKTLTFLSNGICTTIYEGAFMPASGDGLSTINLNGNKITNVKAYSFKNCKLISSFDIENLVEIGESAFENCIAINNITLNKVANLGKNAFKGCVGVTAINLCTSSFADLNENDTPFYGTGNISRTVITIDNSITQIPANLFENAIAKEVKLSNKLTTIGNNAFKNCTGFKGDNTFTYNLPSTLTTIGGSAFEGSDIKMVVLDNNIESIGSRAFAKCDGIIQVEFNIVDYKGTANQIFSGSGTTQGRILIGSNVEKIPQNMFMCSSSEYSNFKYIRFADNSNCLEIGANAFRYNKNVIEAKIPKSVTQIGAYAYADLLNLQTLNIEAQELLDLQETSRIFNNMGSTSLSVIVTFSQYVSRIPKYMFSGDNIKLTEVHFNNENLVESGENAFVNATSLDKVYITNLAKWCDMSFVNRYSKANPIEISENLYMEGQSSPISILTIPDSVSEIKPYVFYNLKTITQIRIPGSVTKIGNEAFECMGSRNLQRVYILDLAKWCNIDFTTEKSNPLNFVSNVYLGNDSQPTEELVIPDGVKEIKKYAFAGSSSNNISRALTKITLPSGLEKIGEKAFYRSTSLLEVNLPASLYEIGEDAFASATAMQNVYIESVESYLNIEFKNQTSHPLYSAQDSSDRSLWIDNGQTTSVVRNLIIPEGVEEIKPYAFINVKLTSVTFSTTIKTIGGMAFYMGVNESSSNSITTLYIPSNIETIGAGAFMGRKYLATVTIDEGLIEIGARAFKNCTALNTFNIPTSLEVMGAYVFAGTTVSITAPNPIPTLWNENWNIRLEPSAENM